MSSGFHIEDFARDRFEKSLGRYDVLINKVLKNQGFTGWRSKLFMILCAGLIVYLVSVKVLLTPEQQLSLGTAVAFMAVLCWMYLPLESLWLGRQAKQDGIEVASRIQRYLDQIPAVGQMVGAKFLSPLSKLLEFDRVSYTHPTSKKSLLNELALKIPAGRKIALISTDPSPSELESSSPTGPSIATGSSAEHKTRFIFWVAVSSLFCNSGGSGCASACARRMACTSEAGR